MRPVRVARFDAWVAGEQAEDGEPAGRRVADVADVDVRADSGRSPARIAGFDRLDGAAAPPATVADIDGLDGAGRRSAAVAGLHDAGDRDPRGRGGSATPGTSPSGTVAPPGTTARPGRRRSSSERSPGHVPPAGGSSPAAGPPAGGPTDGGPTEGDLAAGDLAGDARSGGASSGDVLAGDDGIPPDRPLPRGRRRGARAGRLGPDAPEPGLPEPEADPVAVAREICLRLLTDRARTREELARALARKGVPGDAAAAVLDRFDEVGLIDDAAFAGQWVRSRHAHRGLGRRAIAVELRRKGVADDVAGEALAEVDAESEARRARELVDRKLRSLAVETPEQRAAAGRRLVGMLARRGYGAGAAYRVVREALAERGAEADELGPGEDPTE